MGKSTKNPPPPDADVKLIKDYENKNTNNNPPPPALPEKNSSEFESALEELKNTYPKETYGLECSVYKKDLFNKKLFARKLDYFPDESDIQQKFGPGEYILYCSVFEDGKRRFIKSVTLNILDIENLNNKVPVLNSEKPEPKSALSEMAEQIKLYKELGIIPKEQNNGNDSLIGMLTTLLTESNKTTQALMLRLAESKPAPTQNDEILKILLAKALDKGDPLKDINTIIKIKDSLTTDSGDTGGDMWDNIGKALPAFLQLMASNNNNGPRGPVQPGKPGMQLLKNPGKLPVTSGPKQNLKSVFLQMLKDKDVREEFKNVIAEYDSEAESPVSEQEETPLENVASPEEITTPFSSDGNPQNQNNTDMNFLAQMFKEKIANATEDEKVAALQEWLDKLPQENVKQWLMENGIITTNEEWTEWVKKAGYEDETLDTTSDTTENNG